ncbi:MAG: BtrH N-terminal domain-containing protein, partial [Anaerolineae bacterium]|nr:BtrH N-terminal domain-containing protein [Anaerolineae bacterium]
MPVLTNYRQFSGLHWETGVLHNLLAYQGITAPHSGQPLSEALLMGVTGGITAGYFVFEYEGSDPYLHFLTYHLYNGAPTVLYDRLAIKKQTKQTNSGEKAFRNLDDVLQAGKPAVIWADMFSLTYN